MSIRRSMPSMSREKLQRLISRAQQTPLPPSPAETEPFDWTCPHRFGAEACSVIEALGKRLALSLQKALNEQFNQTVEADLKEIREHCAYRLMQATSQGVEGPYVIGLRDGSKQCIGCLIFSFDNACLLIAQMLNDSEAAVGQEGRFSALEESILMDVASLLTVPLDDVLQEQIQLSVQVADNPLRGDWAMRAKVLEDLCEVSFGLRFGDQEAVFSMVLESTFLDLYAGVLIQPAVNPSQGSARILERLRKAPVSVCAELSAETICLEDLARLESGDVLVLGKKITSPVQVLLNGRACFQAYPAEQKGKIALVITEPENEYE